VLDQEEWMRDYLLKTKFHIPPLRPGVIHRSHLIKTLTDWNKSKLTLICAPAGYGKTTLATEWALNHQEKVAWLSLAKDDNDPTLFWSYFIAALEVVVPGFGSGLKTVLRTPQHFSIDVFLSGLINEIFYLDAPITLILDDYHLIETKPIHTALFSLISRMPNQMKMVISTRSDPPFSLGRLRSARDLLEIRIDDVRFGWKETNQLFKREFSTKLTEDELMFLYDKTEGWVAGLHLAVLSLKNHSEKQNFFSSFTGDDRYIADYLVEEVLAHQPDHIEDFLLQTSILERLSGPLCDLVLNTNSSQEILDYLDENNMFLVGLDNNRRWYRYHHLFADLLRRRLLLKKPEHIPSLHKTASTWFQQHGYIHEAVHHAFLANDDDSAARLAQSKILDLITRGEFDTIRTWIEKFPPAVILANPWLGVADLWQKVFSGELHDVSSKIEKLLTSIHEDNPERDHIFGHTFSVQACLYSLLGDQSKALELSQKALDQLPENDYFARGFSYLTLGLALRWKGDFESAVKAYSAAQQVSLKSEDSFVYVYSSCFKGYALVLMGNLHGGYREFKAVIQHYTPERGSRHWTPPVLGLAYSFLSGVLLRWCNFEEALENARKGLDLSKSWGNMQAIQDGYFFYIQALAAWGDIDNVKEAIEQARSSAEALSPFQQLDVFYQEGQLYLEEGNLDKAAALIEKIKIQPDDEIGYIYLQTYQVLAKFLRLKKERESAAQLLSRLLRIAKESGVKSKEMEIHIEQALLYWDIKDKPQALRSIELALSIAEAEKNLYPFLMEGQNLIDLLEVAATKKISIEIIGDILHAFRARIDIIKRSDLEQHPALTRREKQVLDLLAAGQTSTQVAEELFISVGTARTHIKNIYQKLNVHNRVEAVNKAKDLSLL
jgi:LuxR family maltose regulon positive regulatory protein